MSLFLKGHYNQTIPIPDFWQNGGHLSVFKWGSGFQTRFKLWTICKPSPFRPFKFVKISDRLFPAIFKLSTKAAVPNHCSGNHNCYPSRAPPPKKIKFKVKSRIICQIKGTIWLLGVPRPRKRLGNATCKFFLIIRLPLELLPVLGPLEQWHDAYTWRGPAV